MILLYCFVVGISAAVCVYKQQYAVVVWGAFVVIGFIGQSIVDAIKGNIK
jgi:hypothetical protein